MKRNGNGATKATPVMISSMQRMRSMQRVRSKIVLGFRSQSTAAAASRGKSHTWVVSEAGGGQAAIKMLRLSAPPVNVLSREVLSDLLTKLQSLRGDENVHGVVLSSGRPGIFSAGLDIMELLKPDPKRIREYLSLVQNVFLSLYIFPKPVVAAVVGAAPAGGCWLACQADYRCGIDAKTAVMGLNETKIGIVAPFYFALPLVNLVGMRVAERMLQLGELLPPQEALRLGLFDELHSTVEQVEAAAVAAAARFASIPADARAATKLALRQPLVDRLHAARENELERFVVELSRPVVQGQIERYLSSIKSKSA